MKKLLSFFFVIAFSLIVFAQKTVTGIITDADGKALASASVTIEEPGKNAILAYGISNAKGEYKVTFTSPESNLDLKIKAFNQKPITQSIRNDDQKLNFSLDSQATEIQEVRLKTKLITKKGDTISYDLKSFENKNDRTLADVLKKIPGIEVNKDGTVLYQGEAINKFYVNGKDLMEGGYGTINNSLPKDAVSKVEVLENHQPVSILRDKVPSDQAALNIKLKKSVTMTGRGEVGAGFSPLLWNVKLTPMFFGQKNQWVVNYKANNNGESVEKEGNLLSFGSRWEGRRSQAKQSSWTNVETAGTPDVPEKRYLLNNVHFVSANLLTNPFKNKEWELKANVSYTNNDVERDSHTTTVYDDNPTNGSLAGRTLEQSRSNDFYTNAAKAELIFTKNAKKGFFKNTTTWNGFWNANRGFSELDTNVDAQPYIFGNQSLESPSGSFQNSLSTIIPWKDKLINVMSYFKYQRDKQTMSVNPASYTNFFTNLNSSNVFDTYRQQTLSETTEINHSASVGFTFKKLTIIPEIGLNMNFNNLKSLLTGSAGGTYYNVNNRSQNNIDWNELTPYTQVAFNYKSDRLNMNITVPMNFYSIRYQDNLYNQLADKTKTAFEPTFFASYDFASFFKYWVFANQSYDFGNFGFLYGGDLLTSAGNISRRYVTDLTDSQMPDYLSRNIGTRLEYRNPLNNLFFNVRYNYGTLKRNIAETFDTAGGIGGTIGIVAVENSTKSQSESAEIGKYLPKFKSNISTSFTNTDSNSFSYFNGNFIESKNNVQTWAAKFNNAYFSWLSVDYNISMNWSNNKNVTSSNSQKNSGWNHNLAAYIYPSENHTFGFNWDNSVTSTQGNTYKNPFYDISYQYTWVKKKIDFELKWLNITNRKVYEIVNVDITRGYTQTQSYNIRPSQFMFTVKFNFK
ncbi:Plug and carboxypeptidase regulatory-like domain-containing protein [Epilithonimonas sp. JDS]|uniref:Plug and carboxypeptidase regulatory-like domain-containing protein n=1 Tax=Epilithonimonas sp. JDS TaxID=2902797 RepID=UPI001E3B3361|nr:Plug and carboxypeptidase regulatory-like domain-containing protein [Epilithonimonas sp. JDS]MCD9854224.1 Plug and carboxypeptidase regulatory-like domain-containing protein [Epilithonimonas sp. JDS]